MGTWLNNDKLYIKFGATEGAVPTHPAGTSPTGASGLKVALFDITLASLGAVGTPTILSDVFIMPKNARVEKIELIAKTTVDSASDTAALNVGLIQTDRATPIDLDGLVDSAAQADFDVINETKTITVVASGAGGTLMDEVTSTTLPGYVCAYYETEAFTEGVVHMKVYWRMNS